MRKLPGLLFVVLAAFILVAAQNEKPTASRAGVAKSSSTRKNRGPIFRATTDQIKQAQNILKQRNLYAGNQTGKLDTDTRAGLKKYQEAEGLKATGTLNKDTLQKMAIELTDRQKAM